ncbi:MAG: oligopeptide transporter, OPT family [Eubacteriales bacterium]|nr:oligopeptide transporter, OPT family [Eubacteriales bacterium]
MDEKNSFKPYISADRNEKELSATSVIAGVILAVIFGAANAYLGLIVGMTVSASIPAAVIGMGVIRFIAKRNSILESNMIQTIGSAGESLAAGVIFTLPAMFLWAAEGVTELPSMFEITAISLVGGLLGIFFMIPLRNALIVKEHGILPYPEGMACSEVLLSGEKGGSDSKLVFVSMGIAAVLKFIVDGLKIVKSSIGIVVNQFKGAFNISAYPALVGVGYICGTKVSATLFAGSVLSWLVLIPIICLFGADMVLYPGTATIASMWAEDGASAIWSSYIRYIGAGAVATGGIISLIKSLPLIVSTFRDSMKGLKGSKSKETTERTAKDIPMKIIILAVIAIALFVDLLPAIPVNFVGAVLIIVCGFFFATVASRIVGLVGSSNSPVSGMTIATLLVTAFIFKMMGNDGAAGMVSAMAVGSVIAIITAISGDTSQDLKTGYIVGATPMKQQIGEIIGVVASAVAIGGVLYLLNAAWGFGTEQLAAPQATLMKMIVEGVMGGNLPWNLVFIGVFIAVVVELLGISVMSFAIGIYLPIETTACIMLGGIVRAVVEKRKYKNKEEKDTIVNKGILACSGMIAGEGLVGILLAVFAVIPVGAGTLGSVINLSKTVSFGSIGTLFIFAAMIFMVLKATIWSRNNEK